MLLTHIFYGILAMIVGALALKYNYQLVGLTGRQDWIENKLGSGSTYSVYKLLAIALVIGGALYMTGLDHFVTDPILNPLKGIFNGGQNGS